MLTSSWFNQEEKLREDGDSNGNFLKKVSLKSLKNEEEDVGGIKFPFCTKEKRHAKTRRREEKSFL